MGWLELLNLAQSVDGLVHLTALPHGTGRAAVVRAGPALGPSAELSLVRVNDELASAVAPKIATACVIHQDCPEENWIEATRAMALLLHSAIVRYVSRNATEEGRHAP